MHTIQVMTRGWKRWIDANLTRGGSDVSMVESMADTGIYPGAAHRWLGGVKAAASGTNSPNTPEPAPATSGYYRYEDARMPVPGNTIKTRDRDAPVTVRMTQPALAIFENVRSTVGCDELIRLSRTKLQRSTIVDPITGIHTAIEDRSSYGTFFALNETAFIAQMDRRIANVMHLPIENGEGMQVFS